MHRCEHQTTPLRTRTPPPLGRCWLWLLLCCLVSLSARELTPLNELSVVSYDSADGLPHDMVLDIAQTPDGYLWIATWEGLLRYNGRDFYLFDRASAPELQDSSIRALAVDHTGTLWLGTSHGGLYSYANEQFKAHHVQDGVPSEQILGLDVDARGRLWIVGESGGLGVYADGKFSSYKKRADGQNDFAATLLSVNAMQDESVWVGSSNGAYQFDGQFLREVVGLPSKTVRAFAQQRNGDVLIGTDDGLFISRAGRTEPYLDNLINHRPVVALLVDPDGALWIGLQRGGLLRVMDDKIESLTSANGLPSNRLTTIFSDQNGDYWVGTTGGLSQLKPAPFFSIGLNRGLADNYVRSVFEDQAGRMWIGTAEGLNRMDAGKVIDLSDRFGSKHAAIMAIAQSADKHMWLGTYGQGVFELDAKDNIITNIQEPLPAQTVRAILASKNGDMWFASDNGLVRRRGTKFQTFGAAQGMPNAFVSALFEDRDGRVYAGTATGFVRIEGDKITTYTQKNGFPGDDIFAFFQDRDGTLWIASDAGLIEMQGERFLAYNSQNGLPIDTVFGINEDSVGDLWLGSNRGVVRIARASLQRIRSGDAAKLESRLFGRLDGMASAQCNGGAQPSQWLDSGGRIWFATAKGAAVATLARLKESEHAPPSVMLEGLAVDGTSFKATRAITLDPGRHRVELDFVGINLHAPSQVNYRTRMIGQDLDWTETGARHHVTYLGLAPGKYRFQVQASVAGGPWNDPPMEIAVTQRAALTDRPIFWGVLATLLTIGGMLLYRYRLREFEHQQIELQTQVKLRTTELEKEKSALLARDAERDVMLGQIRKQAHDLEHLASHDPLTGLPNRRAFSIAAGARLREATDAGRPISLAVADLDRFKEINYRFLPH
jgi:ligand-binding sensor domain-containing protein